MSLISVIQWPNNPEEGDIYISPSGAIWIFDGCMWVSTCCAIGACDPISQGITFSLNIEGEFFNLPFYYYTFGGYEGWVCYFDGSPFLFMYQDGPIWKLINTVGDGGVLAFIINPIPIGVWSGDDINATSTCGIPDSQICLSNDNLGNDLDFWPILDGSGSLISFSTVEIWTMTYDTINGQWVLNQSGNPRAFIIGDPNTAPIGTWTNIPPFSGLTVSSLGKCPCDPFPSSLSISFVSTFTGEPGHVYFNFVASSSTLFTSPVLGLTIELIDSIWYITDGSIVYGSSTNLLGPWNPEEPSISSIDSECGVAPYSVGCLIYIDTEFGNIVIGDFIRLELDNGTISFVSDEDYQIIFDPEVPTWYIQQYVDDSWVTIGSIEGDFLGPWGSSSNYQFNPYPCSS